MDGLPILLVVVVVAIAIAAIVLAAMAAKKRREDLANLAQRLGWRFSPDKDHDHDDEYAHFEVFRRGHSRYAYNTLTGDLELGGHRFAAKCGDFRYLVTSSNGKSTTTTTYRFSYLILHLPYRTVPDLLIRPEGLFDKLAGVFGFDDIDFESHEFSRKFHVKCADRRFAYDVVHPRMMEFLLEHGDRAIDIEKRRCCLSDGRRCWSPEQFEGELRFLERFFGLWPRHVLADIAG